MLKRIQKIINIGKFSNCHPPGCQFEKETIIFGLNTQGKSTLTAILRSIKTGNNRSLVGRKTLGSTGAKNIEIDFDEAGTESKYIYQNRAWNKVNPNILIFDAKFITDNVFDGEGITFDQQRNLNTIIIGKKGQELNREITELQKQSDEYTSQKSEKSRDYSRHFPDVDFEKFRSLPEDKSIDEKITNKNKEIKFEQEKEDIKELINSHLRTISNLDFDIKNALSKTLDIKQKEIEEHIQKNLLKKDNAEGFLDKGLDFLKDKPSDGSARVCVFCGQELNHNAETLISIFSQYFRGGYKQLQDEVSMAIDSFLNENIEAIFGKIASDLKDKDLDINLDDSKIAELANLKKTIREGII